MQVKLKPKADSWNSEPADIDWNVDPASDTARVTVPCYDTEGEYSARELAFSLAELRHMLGYTGE